MTNQYFCGVAKLSLQKLFVLFNKVISRSKLEGRNVWILSLLKHFLRFVFVQSNEISDLHVAMSVGTIFSRGGALGDFSKICPGVQSSEICLSHSKLRK